MKEILIKDLTKITKDILFIYLEGKTLEDGWILSDLKIQDSLQGT